MSQPRITLEAWALEAIEMAASKRAMEMLYHDQRPFGLTLQQISLLKKFYEEVTGKQAHKIKGSDLHKHKPKIAKSAARPIKSN